MILAIVPAVLLIASAGPRSCGRAPSRPVATRRRPSASEEEHRRFTIALFSVADALLHASMEQVLETLPFSDEIAGALLRLEGPLGRTLGTVRRYEQGHVLEGADPAELAQSHLAALKWADDAGRWVT